MSVAGLDETAVGSSASPLKGAQTQLPFDAVCQRFLGLKFRKRKNQMNAFIESKITMALYQRWRSLKGLPATMALCSEDAPHMVSLGEALLKPFGSQINVVPEEKSKAHIPVAVTNHIANQQMRVFTGAELEKFVQDEVRECLRRKLQKFMLKL